MTLNTMISFTPKVPSSTLVLLKAKPKINPATPLAITQLHHGEPYTKASDKACPINAIRQLAIGPKRHPNRAASPYAV